MEYTVTKTIMVDVWTTVEAPEGTDPQAIIDQAVREGGWQVEPLTDKDINQMEEQGICVEAPDHDEPLFER